MNYPRFDFGIAILVTYTLIIIGCTVMLVVVL